MGGCTGKVILPNSHTWTCSTHPHLYVKVQTMTFTDTAARTVPVRSSECFFSSIFFHYFRHFRDTEDVRLARFVELCSKETISFFSP